MDLRLRAAGARIRVRMSGQPADGGGLVMSRSAVTVGPPGDAAHYRGRVTALGGTSVRATVGDGRGGTLRLALALQLDGPQVGGTVVATAGTRRRLRMSAPATLPRLLADHDAPLRPCALRAAT